MLYLIPKKNIGEIEVLYELWGSKLDTYELQNKKAWTLQQSWAPKTHKSSWESTQVSWGPPLGNHKYKTHKPQLLSPFKSTKALTNLHGKKGAKKLCLWNREEQPKGFKWFSKGLKWTCSAALEKKGDIWHPRFTAQEKPNGAHQPSQKRHAYNIH